MLGLNFIFRKAQATVDNAIAQVVWGSVLVVPLLIAAGFATAAGSNYLHRIYEPEIANLIVAGIFLGIAALIGIGYALRKPETSASEELKAQQQSAERNNEPSDEDTLSAFGGVDRDILMAALTSAAPYAVRPVLGAAFRNLPLLLVVAIGAFVLSRPSTANDHSTNGVPAE